MSNLVRTPKTDFLAMQLINCNTTLITAEFLNFGTPKLFAVITREICQKSADGMASSVDPDQTAAIDMGEHDLLRLVCLKTSDQ